MIFVLSEEPRFIPNQIKDPDFGYEAHWLRYLVTKKIYWGQTKEAKTGYYLESPLRALGA